MKKYLSEGLETTEQEVLKHFIYLQRCMHHVIDALKANQMDEAHKLMCEYNQKADSTKFHLDTFEKLFDKIEQEDLEKMFIDFEGKREFLQ